MSRKQDEKITRISGLLGPAWSQHDLTTLCRLGDTTTVPAGSLLQQEDGLTRWCYWLLSGSAVVSQNGEPLAMCGPGSLLPGGASRASRRTPVSVEALDDV